MRIIEEKNFPMERALYGENGIELIRCSFDGAEDGESAIKEASDIKLDSCFMNLRYPLWHCKNVEMVNTEMTEKCRAAIWYTDHIKISSSKLHGIKVVRESSDIDITDTDIVSQEFGWKCRDISLKNTELTSEYPFFMSSNIKFDHVQMHGKYSFQYTENVVIENSVLDTKDAFWHSKNVTVKNSVVKGEYLAWYSEGLTLINCKISGTQPLCYCKDLKLIDCEMEGTDFSFEYSEVEADVKGSILSVKNPISGHITADSIGEIMLTADSKYECRCDIRQRK